MAGKCSGMVPGLCHICLTSSSMHAHPIACPLRTLYHSSFPMSSYVFSFSNYKVYTFWDLWMYEDALQAANQAVAVDSTYVRAHNRKANTLAYSGRNAQVMPPFPKA